MFSVNADSRDEPVVARWVYFNFQDDNPKECRKLQAGLTDNGSGLFGGYSSLFSSHVVIRCGDMANGRYRTELRLPYMNVDHFMRTKGF